ncbi:peptide ABC transporter substrate-binding protein [Blautia obeum]|uniref:peptide ABC transporter substrate-binding protein n=1 Tax=Blautia obeum TaxID=40520 RepID=UPI003CFD6E70
MMLKKILAMTLAVVMSFSMLTGCGGTSDSGKKEVSEETSKDTQVLNVRTNYFGNNFDVQDMGWRWMMAACYSGLYRNVADESGEHFELEGAEKVDVSDDGTEYTFYLRKDAKWSDGKPVTAHDYEYGWKRLLNPKYAYGGASSLYNVVGAKEYNLGEGKAEDVQAVAVDDYTFKVTLIADDPTFTSKLVATPLYPTREDLAEAAGENWGKDWSLCVYNGPFCMTELVEDNKMVWKRNEYYWNKKNTKLDSINWFFVAEDATAATMFENDEIDILQTTGEYSQKYKEKAEAGEIQMIAADYPGTTYLGYEFKNGGKSKLMGNQKIRQALTYSIDREEMIETAFGQYKPAYGLIPPALSVGGESYRKSVEEPLLEEYKEYNGDSEKLQALFKEGLKELNMDTDLSKVTITYLSFDTTAEDATMREYLQQTWQQKLGIRVELNTVSDYTLYAAEQEAGNYDVYQNYCACDSDDPMYLLTTFYAHTLDMFAGSYNNPEFDAVIDSFAEATDDAKRLEVYKQAEQILFDDCAFIPIYYTTKEYFLKPWVKDFRWSSYGASQEFYITYIEGRGK